MKNLLLILLLSISAVAYSQKVPQNLGNKNTEIKIQGGATIDSVLRVPLDTLQSAADGSLAIKNGRLYRKQTYWKETSKDYADSIKNVIDSRHDYIQNANGGDTLVTKFNDSVLRVKAVVAGANVNVISTDSTITINSTGGDVKNRYSITKATGDSLQLVNDTLLTANSRNLVYGFWGENQPRYKVNSPDTTALAGQMRMSQFSSVAALKASSYHTKGFRMAFTESYYGDGDRISGAKYIWVDTSTATPDDMVVIKPTSVSGAGRWIYSPENGVYNIRQLGAKADGATSIRSVVQSVINGVAVGNVRRILVPIGNYYSDSTITITDRGIELLGESGAANGLGSIINFPPARTGIVITRTVGYQYARLHDLVILATGHISDPSEQYNGVDISAISRVERVTVAGFSGNGIVLHGNVGLGTDVSLSIVSSATCSSNEASGFKMYYGDGNQITLLNCDARDNGKYGFNDSSFLGNQFYGCHGNNNILGHYKVWDINARSSFIGCYGEAGSAASAINGASIVLGGIHANGVTTAPYVEGSSVFNAGFNFTKVGNSGQNISAWAHEGQIDFNGENGGTLYFRDNGQLNHTHYSFDFGNGNYGKKSLQLLDGGSHLTPAYLSTGEAPEYTRDMQTFGIAARNLYSDGRRMGVFYYSYPSTFLSNQFFDGVIFRTGDVFTNGNYTGSQVEAVKCIVPGTYGTYSEGRTATGTGTTVKLNAATSVIKLGDYLTINGMKTQVISINSGKDTLTLETGVTASASAITYAQPTFTAVGRSFGTSAQKPTLTVNDKGYPYFNTDDSTYTVWSGYQWLSVGSGGGGGSYTADESTLHLTGSQFSVKTTYDATLAKLAGNQTFTGNNTFSNAITGDELQSDGSTRIYKTTTAGYPAWRITANGGGASFQLQNLNSGGYTGVEYLDHLGNLGVFTGFKESTGEFRFNNIASGGTIAFKINSDDALVINNDKTITTNYSGTGNRLAYFNSSGVFGRTSIDPDNIVQSARTITINGTTQDLSADRSWTISTSGAVTPLDVQTTDLGNTSTSETDLHSFPIPANTQSADKDEVDFYFSYDLAANTNLKTISVYYGSTQIVMPGINHSAGGKVEITGRIIRASSSTAEVSGTFVAQNGSNPYPFSVTANTLDFTSPITLKSTAIGGATNDVKELNSSIRKINHP